MSDVKLFLFSNKIGDRLEGRKEVSDVELGEKVVGVSDPSRTLAVVCNVVNVDSSDGLAVELTKSELELELVSELEGEVVVVVKTLSEKLLRKTAVDVSTFDDDTFEDTPLFDRRTDVEVVTSTSGVNELLSFGDKSVELYKDSAVVVDDHVNVTGGLETVEGCSSSTTAEGVGSV